MRRAEPGHAGVLALFGATLTVLLVSAAGEQPLRAAAPPVSVRWEGLVGAPRATVAVGQRMLVVLKARSLADRVAATPSRATPSREQAWTSSALAQQDLLLARIALQGVEIRPDFRFSRVLVGFSAELDARAVALLERDQAVQGVYPMRVAYPASLTSNTLERKAVASSLGNAQLSLPGYDGRGITIALLDTGVDRVHPSLLGTVADGIDVVTAGGDASPQAPPGRPLDVERHGTELAGILAGDRGPAGTNGVATGATVLPIRVAGWQPDARGGWAIYARTDQLIEGIERAVDPNADGDAHDAVRVALVGVAAPFAGFADDPLARAVSGALKLGTLVVAPAGNDGTAGPGFGSIAGPGGAPDALTVGAADTRARVQRVQVSLRRGLEIVLARTLPLIGELAPARPLHGAIVAPVLAHPRADFATLTSYFTAGGLSLVAGRIALVPAGDAPADTARNAALAGATAVVLYGAPLPPGGVALDEETAVPVVSIPAAAASKLLSALSAGASTVAAIGPARDAANASVASVASFSSTGLAFDGRVKPDVVMSGVGIATAEPGSADDGSPRYGTVSGTSAAAAAVAGAAAVLAQARPRLSADALRGVLVGTAAPLPGQPIVAQGAGLVSLGRAAAAELAADPTTLALGNARDESWKTSTSVVVHNVSTRPLRVRVTVERSAEGAAAVLFHARPDVLTLRPGAERTVRIDVGAASAPTGVAASTGTIVLTPAGGSPVRVPWVVTFEHGTPSLLGALALSTRTFAPSDDAPALLSFQAGGVGSGAVGDEIEPVSLLKLDLLQADGSFVGTLLTLRDLLPGRYSFGLTGRGPSGKLLAKGAYEIRVTAVPSLAGPVSSKQLTFAIK
ncbi:MAG: S8 family serine peptidase [Gaiellaceae bacterium]